MKKITLILLSLLFSLSVKSQDKNKVEQLITEGIQLYDASKYQEAIVKYKEALQIDPDHPVANYEIALTLYNTSAKKESIPYLSKVVQGTSNSVASAYDLLGSIYDDDRQPDQAIAYYKLGLKANPNYQRLYFNLAISYTRQGKYEEALTYAEKALQLDRNHASSHWIYATASKANPANNIKTLLAYCNFLLLEPTSERSAKVYQDLLSVLNSNVSVEDGKNKINLAHNEKDPDINAANLLLSISAFSVATKTTLSDLEKMELRLKTIFSATGEISAKKKEKDFFWSFYADYFDKLSKTEFMPLVTQLLTFTTNKEGNGKWLLDREQQLNAFSKWQNEQMR